MKFKRRLELKQGIDLTPMIDVVFNLLIFFMVGSTLIETPQIKITLPKSSSAQEGDKENKNIIVSISKEGKYYINSTEVLFAQLQSQLSELSKEEGAIDKVVQIRSDEEVQTRDLINVIDSVKNAGFSRLSIATESKQ